MKKTKFVIVGVIVTLIAGILNGQAPVQFRAAASTPVAGWERMPSPGGDALWVSPDARLTAGDIARAEARSIDGQPAVEIVLTDEGARKMSILSTEQIDKPIALLLDGKVIWAPVVRSAIGKAALLTGGPGGLTKAQIDRLLTSFKK
ncbi:MAG TPA: hypothetical protein VEA16_08035 [Vicinamibacterales bacterium]|nr:hypothetical protein [Vicinamibacterales bacterium]